MKKKMILLYISIFIYVVMMASITWFFNKTLFYIETSIAGILGIILFIVGINFNRYKNGVLEEKLDQKTFCKINKCSLEKIKIPVLLVDKDCNILWNNQSFKKILDENKISIVNFISIDVIKQVINKDVSNIECVKTRYNVLNIKLKEYTALYFIEDEHCKQIEMKYSQSRPVVAMIMFDNKEEFESDTIDSEEYQIVAKVESAIQKWSAITSGFYKKLNNSRYLVIFEEKDLQEFTDDKFKVLEEVRNIKLDDRRWATVSIGIGRNGNDLKECELWARNALDMALGRGGDQVVVKSKENYKFFGGVSERIEKRSKVRARVIAMALSNQIDISDRVLIMGHRFSDLDSIGASIGMHSAISKGKNKEAYIIANKDESMALPLIKNFEAMNNSSIFISKEKALGLISEKTLLIIVDTHSKDFLESKRIYEHCKRTVVIDHHRMMVNHISDAVVFYHESYASSASEMVTELVQYLSDKYLNIIEAESLLAGIMLDSKNFVLKTGVRTFEAAAYLRRKGANTVEVKRMFSNSINTYKVKYQLISGAEIFNGCAIACAEENSEDIRIASAQAADELLGIQGVRASFVIYSTGDGSVSISARSFGDVNVQLIMESMGGGGHQTMAGTQINDTQIKEVTQRLIEIISPIEIIKEKTGE